jgi:hypothetical protein
LQVPALGGEIVVVMALCGIDGFDCLTSGAAAGD